MIDIRLEDLELYQRLASRQNDRVSNVLRGILIVISGDANEFLAFVRNRFPAFTGHDLQHSWRIISRIETVLTPDAKDDFSSLELFALITASAFHDVGMTSTAADVEQVRRTHHIISDAFIQQYMADRLSLISEIVPRLSKSIGFVMRAHGLQWDAMIASEAFRRPERILGQQLRTNVLAILLRLGDLLDLDSERSCDALQRHAGSYFSDPASQIHHSRHKHVCHFNYDPSEIAIGVESYTKEEHSLWTEWFSYIRQDILNANTYIFKDTLSRFRLPSPDLEIRKNVDAKYDIWPIRFELDEKGRIFEVISKSIYVGKFDFIRELIQNGIDATLSWMYIQEAASINGEMPRLWSLPDFVPTVVVLFHEAGTLEVRDNGIGMDK